MDIVSNESKEEVSVLPSPNQDITKSQFERDVDNALTEEMYTKQQAKAILLAMGEMFFQNMNKYDEMLTKIGLGSSFDLIMFDFAKSESRLRIKNATKENTLHLIFQLVKKEELMENHRTFPAMVLAEQRKEVILDAYNKVHTLNETDDYILWSAKKSEEYDTRPILSFTEFHRYALSNIKENKTMSLEKLYGIFEERRGGYYFLSTDREYINDNEKLIVLYITPSTIIVYEIPNYDWSKETPPFQSLWINESGKVVIQEMEEVAIYELPPYQIVPKAKEESKQPSFATQGLDTYDMDECEACGA